MNHTLFISDLHLEPERPDITQAFLHFLRHDAILADKVYVLGDLFEAWIGYDHQQIFNQTIAEAIRDLVDRGVSVFLMRGNRDFLLDDRFAQVAKCQWLSDPSVIQLYGKPVILTHGDALCTQDRKHQMFRKLTQNPRYHPFFLKLPLSWRDKIGRFLRRSSRQHTQTLSDQAMDVTESAVLALMRKHEVPLMIHGHTHRPAVHSLDMGELTGQTAQRIVLGDWESGKSVLIYYENGHYELRKASGVEA